jgi:hypothetical protein
MHVIRASLVVRVENATQAPLLKRLRSNTRAKPALGAHLYLRKCDKTFGKEGWYQKGICAQDAENLLKS